MKFAKLLCSYICIFTNEPENHIYADQRSRSTNPCTAVSDDGP